MKRRSVLGSLAGGGLVGVAGCLGGVGFGGEQSTPTPLLNRELPARGDADGSAPQFQGSPEHTGQLDTVGPTGAVSTYWRRTPHRYDHSQPVVHGDRVYVSFAGNLVRLDRATGEQQWLTDVGHDGASTPAIYDNTVYVTVWNGGANVDRGLAAVDAENGDIKWRSMTDADMTTAPAVTADGVFVGGGYETTTVAAFDHDGTERWRHTLDEYASTPAVADGTVFYGAGTARVVAYDAVSGKQKWQFETDGDVTAAPTVANGRVVIGTPTGTLYAIDALNGSERWTVELSSPVHRSVAVAEDRVIVPTEESVVAVDGAGTRQWTNDDIPGATAPVVAGDGVYLAEGSTVRALSVGDGTEWWSFDTRERSYTDVVLQGIRAAPTVSDGFVIVATQTGDVYALGEE